MSGEPLRLPGDSEDLGLGDDTSDISLDMSLDDAESLDLQAFADEVADATPDEEAPSGTRSTGNTVNLDDPEPLRDERTLLPNLDELQGQLAASLAQLKTLEQQEQETLDQFRRLSKDFTNFRARSARDIQMGVEQAERKLLLEFLPILDSFDRSLESTYEDMDAFWSGVVLIRKQFQDALRRCGVEPAAMEVGDPFSAHTAEALSTTSRQDLLDGCLAAIYERAYMLRDQLLRPAKVVVNHRPGGSEGFLESPDQAGAESPQDPQ
jgi:molecular chaperone GrpE